MNGMGAFLMLAFISADSANYRGTEQRVDLIELNHFFDENGRHVFDQVIFYDWSERHHRYHVQAWRLVKDKRQLPTQTWKPNGYRCVWHDDGLLRVVHSPAYRETWSQVDPERTNRKMLPQDRRVGLMQPIKINPPERPIPSGQTVAANQN